MSEQEETAEGVKGGRISKVGGAMFLTEERCHRKTHVE